MSLNLDQATNLVIQRAKQLVNQLVMTRGYDKPPFLAEEFAPLGQLKQAAFSTKPGQVSSYHPTAEGGFILYVKDKLPIDPQKEQADMPTFLTALRRSRQQEAFDDWFRKEAERGLRDTPLAKPQPSAIGSAAKS